MNLGQERLTAAEGADFAARLAAWFASAMRPLPWREKYTPYEVWLSEIMLQQTQAERGAEYFRAWMRRFPDIRSVAEAPEKEILAAWEGLGYYSRARNLHAAAKRIVSMHNGEFPDSVAAIRALPGVGEYTAGAVAAIAFNIPEPAIDANVLRIFARILDIDSPPTDKTARRAIAETVRWLMPLADSPRQFCQALMELGALICGRTPKCGACPVMQFCEARRLGVQQDRPRAKAKAAYTAHEVAAGIVFHDHRVYIRQRPAFGLWAGMWEFPCGPVETGETPESAAARHVADALGITVRNGREIAAVRHGYTTHRVTMHGFIYETETAPGSAEGLWATRGEIRDNPFPAGHRKLLERLGMKAGRADA